MSPSSMIKCLAGAATLVLSTVLAQSVPPVYEIGTPSILGSGCPMGSVTAVPSMDAQSITVLFQSYGAESTDKTSRVRKSCNFAIPVKAIPGVAIGFFQVDFRGYAYVPSEANAYASLTNEYFFAGQLGATVQRRYDPGFDDSIYESNTVNFQSVVWSPCGGSTNFRINSAVQAVKGSKTGEDVVIQVDSLDSTVRGEVQVYVTWQNCTAAADEAGIPDSGAASHKSPGSSSA